VNLEQALRSARPIAVWADGEQVRYLLEAQEGVRECSVALSEFSSYAAQHPSLDWFERTIWESRGIEPKGHPDLRPLRHHSLPYTFEHSGNPQVHEVAVGPVHAGIIEPGHFRFSVLGERILNLELRLGYQHRGIERLLVGASIPKAILLAERVGSEPLGHALCLCMVLEKITGVEVPPRAKALRLVLLELERIFQHLGHLAGMFSDIGYTYAHIQVGKVRALVQGQLEKLCGHRYGRNTLRVGGLWFDRNAITIEHIGRDLKALGIEVMDTLSQALENPLVIDRMRSTGRVSKDQAMRLGMVGPAARASAIYADLRVADPHYLGFIPATRESGDVMARALVYADETEHSFGYVDQWLGQLPEGNVIADVPHAPQSPDPMESWHRLESARGELFWWVRLQDGKIASACIVDPSFKNWRALETAVRGEGLPDFPLCNKSFDLSYAGSDL
jgi:Ni,Fe-hydrogenase III large subunit